MASLWLKEVVAVWVRVTPARMNYPRIRRKRQEWSGCAVHVRVGTPVVTIEHIDLARDLSIGNILCRRIPDHVHDSRNRRDARRCVAPCARKLIVAFSIRAARGHKPATATGADDERPWCRNCADAGFHHRQTTCRRRRAYRRRYTFDYCCRRRAWRGPAWRPCRQWASIGWKRSRRFRRLWH